MSTAFFEAIKAGEAEKIGQMVDSDPSLLSAKDENGLGPFTVARYSRQDSIARMLLDKGVHLDIFAASMAGVRERLVELLAENRELANAYSHDGWTPLHLSSFFGHPETAEVLLANSADVHAQSHNAMRNTPLHAAVA